MYLSRLIINPYNRAARRDIANCHELHRTILKVFPQLDEGTDAPRASLNILHRLETDKAANRIVLYVQSDACPDWTGLEPDYCLNTRELNPVCKSIKKAYSKIPEGSVWRFRLRANPTRKIGTSNKSERLAGKRDNGRRVPILDAKDQIEWLKRKGENGGFQLVSIETKPEIADVSNGTYGKVFGQKTLAGEIKESLCFYATTFDGYLRVTNAERFTKTLKEGIGTGKAYGFGLLSIAKP